MKTTINILIAVFFLSANTLFAASNDDVATTSNVNSTLNVTLLAPVTPFEADFNDLVPETNTNTNLAPVTPAEADFSEIVNSININLAPLAPMEADFNDTVFNTLNSIDLTPNTPAFTDFE